MNRRTLSLLSAIILALSLAGCVAAPESTTPSTQRPTALPTEAPTAAPTELPTEPPTEPAPTSPLTGETLAQPLTGRLFAVSVNNIKAAMPQHGISQADVYCEMLAEGSVTRCLGIFSDLSAVEKLGSIRSARIYTVSLAQMFDAILVRAGGSTEADRAISSLGWDDVNGISGTAGSAFYRDQDRLSSGYALEHTLFTSGPDLIEMAKTLGRSLTKEEPYDFGWSFAADAAPDGEDAAQVTIAYGSGSAKTTIMNYDAQAGHYLASQFGESWIDGSTGETLAFENVLVIKAVTYVQSDGVHKTIELVGSGEGFFACGGKLVPILWSRASDSAPFVFTLQNGEPLTLGIGKSFLGIVPTNAAISWK